MLNDLRFVQGSVAKKEFIPALTHFVIENGFVRGFNGALALCSPIACDLTCNPKAEPLIRAIGNCTDTIQLSMTQAGRLSIKSGKFKAFIDCIQGETAHVIPEGNPVVIDGAILLQALKVVHPFIGDDASRQWTNGVLLTGQSAFATNNVAVIEYWTGSTIPTPINLPRAAVKEMLRIDEAPISVQMNETSITFHYSGNRWLRTQLYESNWPDLSKILDKPSVQLPINKELFEGLEVIKPFTDKLGRVLFRGDGRIATHEVDVEGAEYELIEFNHSGIYQISMLSLLKDVATTIDWTLYPSACLFFGDRVRGALIGMRQ